MNNIITVEEKVQAKGLTNYGKTQIRELHSDNDHLRDDQKEVLRYAINRDWNYSKFKMRHFIGDAQITPFAKIKQYLLELKTRQEVIEKMEYDVKKGDIELEILQYDVEKEEHPIKKKLIALEIEKKTTDMVRFKRHLDDAYIERKKFLDLIDEFNNSPEGKNSDGKLLVEAFGDENMEELYEMQYWTARLSKAAAMDLASTGKINGGNMDAISQLPLQQQAQILYYASDYSVRLEETTNMLRHEAGGNLRQALENHGNKDFDISKILPFVTDTKNLNLSIEHKVGE